MGKFEEEEKARHEAIFERIRREKEEAIQSFMEKCKKDRCIKQAREWGLPFRLLYAREYDRLDEIPPNEHYPQPGRARMNPKDEATLGKIIQKSEAGIALNHREELVLQKADAHEAKQPHLTAENAEYYLTRFLRYAQMDDYGASDWTGNKISDREAERLKTAYQKRLKDFKEHPENYYSQPNPRHGRADHTVYELPCSLREWLMMDEDPEKDEKEG